MQWQFTKAESIPNHAYWPKSTEVNDTYLIHIRLWISFNEILQLWQITR